MDFYSDNPFRILGLNSDASGSEAGKAASRLLKWIEIGEIPQIIDALPYLGSLRPTREQIKQAINEIEDPRARIRAELFWPSSNFSASETCNELIKNGQYPAFVQLCEKRIANVGLDASLGRHYLAIFYHSAAISASRASPKTTRDGSSPADWDQAFKYWFLVMRDDGFWTYLADRVRLLNDPRIDEFAIQEMREALPLEILRVNVTRATASFERGRLADFSSNCEIVRKARFGSYTEKALKEIAHPVQSSFEKAVQEIQPALSETAIRAHVPTLEQSAALRVQSDEKGQRTFVGEGAERELDPTKLTAYLAGLEESINKRLAPIGRLVKETQLGKTEAGTAILDGIAYAFRSLSLAFNNHGGMPHASVRVTKAAREYAATSECKERLDEDYQTLQFLSLQKDASELANGSRYKESLEKLEAARGFASSDQERKTIDEWIQLAKKRLVLEGVKQIDNAPSMYTFNGIGTKLYGKRNYDSASQSYIATLYFTILYAPIFPLSAYRVRHAGGNQYQFLGKVPLKWTAFVGPAVVAIVIALFMIQGNADTNAPTPMQNTSSSMGTSQTVPPQVLPATPVLQGTPDGHIEVTDKESLGEWIHQERVRLTAEDSELQAKASQIDSERRSLDQSADELNAGSPSQDEIDSYEAARQRFNSEVEAFNARVDKHKADVSKFNAEVNRYNAMP